MQINIDLNNITTDELIMVVGILVRQKEKSVGWEDVVKHPDCTALYDLARGTKTKRKYAKRQYVKRGRNYDMEAMVNWIVNKGKQKIKVKTLQHYFKIPQGSMTRILHYLDNTKGLQVKWGRKGYITVQGKTLTKNKKFASKWTEYLSYKTQLLMEIDHTLTQQEAMKLAMNDKDGYNLFKQRGA